MLGLWWLELGLRLHAVGGYDVGVPSTSVGVAVRVGRLLHAATFDWPGGLRWVSHRGRGGRVGAGCRGLGLGLVAIIAAGNERDGHDGPMPEVVLDGKRPVAQLKLLFDDGQAASNPAYVAFHGFGGRGERRLEGCRLVGNAGPLVAEHESLAFVEDRYGRLDERSVDEIFHQFADEHERPVSALLGGKLKDGLCDLVEVGSDVRGLDDFHTGGHGHAVIDRDACRRARVGESFLVSGVVVPINEGVKRFGHGACSPFLSGVWKVMVLAYKYQY